MPERTKLYTSLFRIHSNKELNMTRARFLSLTVLVGFLALSIQAGNQTGKVVPGWGVLLDPDGDCKITATKDKVKIEMPGAAHDFAAELQRWNAPHILTPVTGDVIVDLKVCGELKPGQNSVIDGRRPYHGAGLLLLKDRNNYVSLHRGVVHLDNGARHYANFELRKDGAMAISRYELGIDDQDTHLRVERRGNKFYALASHDGVNWKVYEEPIVADFPADIRVGVVAVSSSDVPLHCSLEGFSVFRKLVEKTGLQ
jgi:regulation of enolase protein 1 (concanavalin A-like superfamily)